MVRVSLGSYLDKIGWDFKSDYTVKNWKHSINLVGLLRKINIVPSSAAKLKMLVQLGLNEYSHKDWNVRLSKC